ncbi:hypothetical protein [Planctomicrobium piriforme]|uniref:Uncharacterized protein n=1 Tax=Planctomicrobium piriforme TaxID=1576369 RepID=A0A1I3JVT1_9PLAN|nr:hypothetical protein [Planctomicrobium piriforme]SFI64362.1 hypothetical protein SAMN05421753_11130 [Planctomicrobium piriforme]
MNSTILLVNPEMSDMAPLVRCAPMQGIGSLSGRVLVNGRPPSPGTVRLCVALANPSDSTAVKPEAVAAASGAACVVDRTGRFQIHPLFTATYRVFFMLSADVFAVNEIAGYGNPANSPFDVIVNPGTNVREFHLWIDTARKPLPARTSTESSTAKRA